jgi:hypothetical protein
MNKMAEKISAAMNDNELMQMIEDHYQGEAQLLTGGAEENLLKLAELRGNITEAEEQRWVEIKEVFQSTKMSKNAEVEIGLRIADKLGEISTAFQHSDEVLSSGQAQLQTVVKHVVKQLHQISTSITEGGKTNSLSKQMDSIATQLYLIGKSVTESSENTPLTKQMEQISTGLSSLGKDLNKTLEQPRIEAALLPQLSTISDQLQQLKSSVDDSGSQSDVAEQLKAITQGVQHMGQGLAEVSETAKLRLDWLRNIKSKSKKKTVADE